MTKFCDEKITRKFDSQKDYLWLCNPSKGKSGGILVGIRLEFYDVGAFSQGEYMMLVNLWDKINKVKWNIIVVYGTAHEENKVQFLAELSNFCSKSNEPTLIGGDFNIIRFSIERNIFNGISRHSVMFNTLINFHELREIVMTGGLYTWSNNQDPPLLEKLDRILVSKAWEDIFSNAMVKKLPRDVSDHNPLIISSGPIKMPKKLQFRFENSWISNPDFLPAVKKIWDKPCNASSTLDKIQQKLKLFKQYFKGWGFNLQGELRKRRAFVSEELTKLELLEENSSLTSEQIHYQSRFDERKSCSP